jgi:hypothetical protein
MSVDPLEARVAALEDQVTALQAQAQPETLTPTYLTTNPDGTVSAKFSGAIQASELDLVAGSGASPIRWLTAAGGLVAELVSDGAGNLAFSPGVLSGPEIDGGTISGTDISGATVTGTTVSGGTISGTTITGGTITGGTVNGGTFNGISVDGISVAGQQGIGFVVVAGATGTGTLSFPGLGASWQVLGYVLGNNILWAVASYVDPTLTIHFFNPGGATASGTLFIVIMGA